MISAGIVSAIGAALTRPALVRHMIDLIAMLQTLWVLFPQIRRQEAVPSDPQVCSASQISLFACH